MRSVAALFIALLMVLLLGSPGRASEPLEWLIPPVDAVVETRFQPPETVWGPGHRGIDYPVPAGTRVRAAGPGWVSFAGPVAGMAAVTIKHPFGLETTYTSLGEVSVAPGDTVAAGSWIGTSKEAHPGSGSGLHLSVKKDGGYVDPELYLGPIDPGRAIMLAPVTWQPPRGLERLFDVPGSLSARHETACASLGNATAAAAPNANLVVVVPGIGSASHIGSSVQLRDFAVRLGYETRHVHLFSYAGTDGPGLHEPYRSTDTFAAIEVAASRLEDLLRELGRSHPGRDVDLIAHSQGGIVARSFLAMNAEAWSGDLPRVAHLVTLSSPHSGAPLAGTVPVLEKGKLSGALLDMASEWALAGGPIPDPYAASTRDLAADSLLMGELAREDLVFGVRGLSLAVPNDAIVPADRTRIPEELHRIVPPAGVDGHDGILGSERALAQASRFLRDGRDACKGSADRWGWLVGRSISFGEAALPSVLGLFSRLWPLP